jgi:putative ABC transport system permease protein
MFKDILAQAWEAMVFNRRRTAITMIGMAWGIATVVLLLAYGAGFSRAIENIFAQWGTNMIGFFPGRTSEQAGGDKAGVRVRFTLDDVDRAANGVPGIFHISPMVWKHVTVQNDLHTYTWSVNGVRPNFRTSGSWIPTRAAFSTGRGPAARPRLRHRLGGQDQALSGSWALGETIRLNGVIFTIVGVLRPKMEESDDDINRHDLRPLQHHERPRRTRNTWTASGSTIAATTNWSRRACAKPWARRITSAPRTTTPSSWPT